MQFTSALEAIFLNLSVAFSEPTANRFGLLMIGAILANGRRTVTAVLRVMWPWVDGHFSSYHRVFSRATWSPFRLSHALTRLIVALLPAGKPIPVAVDETTTEHRGPRVYGKGCHRDAVRSSHTYTTYKWGHKWVVMGIVIKFPFARCPWCLPIMAALYRSKPKPERRGKKRAKRRRRRTQGPRHKTAPELARQMLACLIHWFPQHRFVLLGDGAYAAVELAKFCVKHEQTLVSRLRPDAALYAPPPARRRKTRGRPRIVGKRLDSPEQAAARKHAAWEDATVDWYGGDTREVQLLSGTGLWYKRGRKPVMLRWVCVVDVQGTHRDEYFFSTDVSMTPAEIVSLFTRRWSIEVTFEEVRAHLGLETTRQWVKNSILRAEPCLFGLFTVVSLAFAQHASRHQVQPAQVDWYPKEFVTFSDALATVRQLQWKELILSLSGSTKQKHKIKTKLMRFVLDTISRPAA